MIKSELYSCLTMQNGKIYNNIGNIKCTFRVLVLVNAFLFNRWILFWCMWLFYSSYSMSSFRFTFFLIMCVFMFLCILCVHECRCQRRQEALDHLELELSMIVNCLTWVLGSKYGYSARTIWTLKNWTVSPVPWIQLY